LVVGSAAPSYLYPGAMARLSEKLACQMKDTAVIVSNTFALPQWKPILIIELQDMYHTKVYVYRKDGRPTPVAANPVDANREQPQRISH
jgi:hypothetical protein